MYPALSYYLYPLLAQVALSYLVAALILVTRLIDVIGRKTHRSFYENYGGVGGPILVQRTTHQLANLFEFPTLFLVLMALLVGSGLQDEPLRLLAWLFVGLRFLHTAIHLAHNILWLRMSVFMASNLVLLAMWLRAAWLTVGT